MPAIKLTQYCLGTVQFGLPYGINNHVGQPDRADVFLMLDQALAAGVDCWDTAAAYGEAEHILGEYIRKRRCAANVKLISKLRPDFYDTLSKGTLIAGSVRREVEASLQLLGVDRLDGFFLHRASHLDLPGMPDALQELQASGLVRQIGVSVYEPAQANEVKCTEWMDAIQVPYNVFDQRLDRAGFFAGLEERRRPLSVFARSALLQGLIVMKDDEVPKYLGEIKRYLRELDWILGKYGLDRFSGAVQFVLAHNKVDFLVFGVETPAQLAGYLRLREKAKDVEACWAECRSRFAEIPHEIISPHLWESLKEKRE